MRKSIAIASVAVFAVLAVACGGSSKPKAKASGDAFGNLLNGSTTSTSIPTGGVGAQGDFVADPAKTYTAKIETNLGTITVELDSKHAPKAAGRFIELARAGFYNGLTFHRVVPNFVIQGGDPKGDGSGGSGRPPVAGETPTDGYPVGSLAGAKTQADPPGTFDCQFFIVTGADASQSLGSDYARFGMVTQGMDVVTKIEGLATGADGPPSQKVTMDKVTITES